MQHQVNLGRQAPKQFDPDDMVVSKTRLKLFIGVLFGFGLLGLGIAGYAFYRASSVKSELDTLRETRTQSKTQLVEEVGKLVVLPNDEEPTIATVVDPESLKGQTFFKNAKAGDRVLIYAKDSRAILYDPVAKRVIEIGTLAAPTSGVAPDQ